MWGYPNTELAVRDWLRTKESLVSLLNGTGQIELVADPVLPCVSLYRAGGTTDSMIPLDRAVIRFDCWGTERSRAAAMNLQVALVDCLSAMASEPLGEDVFGYNALIESVLWVPDEGGRSRYVVTALVTTRSLTALAV